MTKSIRKAAALSAAVLAAVLVATALGAGTTSDAPAPSSVDDSAGSSTTSLYDTLDFSSR
jgi:hypothetical protein